MRQKRSNLKFSKGLSESMISSNRAFRNSHKQYVVFLGFGAVLLLFFVFHFILWNGDAAYNDKVVEDSLASIEQYDFSSVRTVEAEIKKLEAMEHSGGSGTGPQLLYRKIFENSVVVGDSITEGLVVYGFLGNDRVFCKIGASVMFGDDMFTSAAKTYPENAFFAFGVNDMGNYTGHADLFIEKYEKLIKDFQKTSPDTKIYVNSIAKPSDGAIARNKILGNYKNFNKAIKEMCERLDLTYIDNIYLLEEQPELYAGDGIHVNVSYYNLWLENMIQEAGL